MNPEKMNPDELEQFIHRELRALPPRKAPEGFEARFQAKLAARQGQTANASASHAALSPEQLEHLVHAELRALPPRRAPHTLEGRVLAAIEQRSAVAWWHRSWSYWPTGVKAAFAFVATAFAGTIVAASYSLFSGVTPEKVAAEAGERLSLFTKLWHAAAWVVDFVSSQVGAIPSLWLYGGLAFVATMYVAFFGLGAVAYRALYRPN
ncbi:MAG: hypothetical protein HYV96_10435 [Opitutae bacterium]|nr:hypothetical protein [Opitutae bacterium]